MAGKPELITELYRRACLQVTASPENWQKFLDSACRNYKCRFDEQLLIYMQRPDATAVLEYEKWNRRFGRWIKKNSRGIAVFETEITSRSIKYYFDISDTRAGENEKPVPIWQMSEQYEEPVRLQLNQMYDLKNTRSLVETLQETAEQIVDNHIEAYLYDLRDCIDGGDLAQLDEETVETVYKRIAANSVAYMLLSRCNMNPREHISSDDMMDIVCFDTVPTAGAIGLITSDLSEQVLREISKTIRTVQNRTIETSVETGYDEIKKEKGSENHESNHIYAERRLSNPKPIIPETTRNSAWQIRLDAPELFERKPQNPVSEPVDQRQTDNLSEADRGGSTEAARNDHEEDAGAVRDQRENEREKSDGMDPPDEQHPQSGGGDHPERSDIQITLFPSETEQQEQIKAEENTTSAFFMPENPKKPLAERFLEFTAKTDYEVDTNDPETVRQVEEDIETNQTDGYITALQDLQEVLEDEKLVEESKELIQDLSNYRLPAEDIRAKGAKERYADNISAIRQLRQLESGYRAANNDEKVILSRYVGWGGLSMAFDPNNAAWSNEYHELKKLLSPEEYRSAMESTLSSFYTPPEVITSMYDALDKLGFVEGKILEPSCGIGNFIGLLPEKMSNSVFSAVEIDDISGRIAKQLYMKADIQIKGFENAQLRKDYFDVVIGNVPFGDFKVLDPEYDKHKFLIHDYFFAKSLDLVRSGGIVMLITSKGTMDKESPEVRRYIAQRAEFLGAIRLPDNTFKRNAGTEVTSDILILKKRDQIIDIEPDWLFLDKDENGITMNSYFVSHPEMIMGEMVMETGRFGMVSNCKARGEKSLREHLKEAISRIEGEITQPPDVSNRLEVEIPARPNTRNFSFSLVDGEVFYRENDEMKKAELSASAKGRIKGLIEIRDSVRQLIDYQMEDYPDEMIQKEQQRLNVLYDSFRNNYGLINDRGNYMAFASDESYFLLCSLEVLDDDGNFKRKADMFSKRTIRSRNEITSVQTASEALAASLGEKARVDLKYMENLSGKSKQELIQELRGLIFQIPGTDRYVTSDEYLSGNVREKLRAAEGYAKANPEFEINVEALRQVQPKDLSAAEITVKLGATWIPTEDIEQFVRETLSPSRYAERQIHVRYMAATGSWYVEGKNADFGNVRANSTFGTKRVSAYHLIEESLNLKDVKVYDYVIDRDGNRKPVLNQAETMAAQAKQQALKDEFTQWIWKDPVRRARLIRDYNDTFNNIRPRVYDGQHLKFEGMSPEITLRPHQINAIARIIYGGNTLLAHKVGAGKTFEIVAAAQELKRIGLCHKSMIVVPNHLVGQWASEYLRLYPAANILVTTKRDFEKERRKKFCARIATGEYDAIIIGHSQFEKIPISIERQREELEQQLDEIERGIEEAKNSAGERFTVKELMRTRKQIQIKMEKLTSRKRKDQVITFEELGVDRLFVDEAHLYKNLFTFSKMRNVAGISQTDAQKSSDMFMKTRYMDEITGGKGVIFATGTPVSNTMVEMYTMQKYLQYGLLAKRGLLHFDNWASIFGETITTLELAPEGTKYQMKTRFAKFHNLPELMQMFHEVADIQTADMLKLPVPEVNYRNIKVKPTEIQKEMVQSLADRADKVRGGSVDPRVDNLLKITNDGRKLALDQRMIDPLLPRADEGKIEVCCENIFDLWKKHESDKAAQVVFCDLSTPKKDGSFNIYDDIREQLVEKGIPRDQIRFIHEAGSDAQKKELFAKVRSGEVRVIIGSTSKMGAGTNVQDRLIALHNLDCPWRPADLEQRQGRIERQGNMFDTVEVFRYVTEQTFDAYLYQLVESKQKFIGQIMTSKSPVRSAEDVDAVALSFAEVKMLAASDTRIKEKMELDIEVTKLRVLKQSYLNERYSLEDKVLQYYPNEIKRWEEKITGYERDIELLQIQPVSEDGKFGSMMIKGIEYTEKADAGKMLMTAFQENPTSHPVEIGCYKGFKMESYYDVLNQEYRLNLCGALKHTVTLGGDGSGNITRIENELERFQLKLEGAKGKREENLSQMENARVEIQKPFVFEEELMEKEKKLDKINRSLNSGRKESIIPEDEIAENDQKVKRIIVMER